MEFKINQRQNEETKQKKRRKIERNLERKLNSEEPSHYNERKKKGEEEERQRKKRLPRERGDKGETKAPSTIRTLGFCPLKRQLGPM